MMSDSAKAPAHIEKCPSSSTTARNAKSPSTMDGISMNTSSMNLICFASFPPLPTSDR